MSPNSQIYSHPHAKVVPKDPTPNPDIIITMPEPQNFEDRLITVSEYLELINEYIKPLNFSITGEISSVSDRAGNAVFFSVSDEKEQAVLECVIWRGVYRNLGFKLEKGMRIKMSGYPNVYKPSGKLSYVAGNIIPTGEGALIKAYEELKKNLEKEGLFAPERKRILPQYIKTVGLITADNSDAKKDFETHLGNFGYKVYFYDVRVEGLKSAENVVQAIKFFNESTTAPEVLVITRGGGSLESLQAFNSEGVARAIYSSKIPVLSAIGHERDVTIADMVAGVRGSTPTDAGKIVSQDWREAEQKISLVRRDILSAYHNNLIGMADYLEMQKEKMAMQFEKALLAQINAVKMQAQQLFVSFTKIFHKFDTISKSFHNNLLHFHSEIVAKKALVVNTQTAFLREGKYLLEQNEDRLKQLENLIISADPKKKLEQGYSITQNRQGKTVKSIKGVGDGDILKTLVIDGEIESSVTALLKKD